MKKFLLLSCCVFGLLHIFSLKNDALAAGGYAHIYITQTALEKIEASPIENGHYVVKVAKDSSTDGHIVRVPVETAKVLRSNLKSYIAGSIAPDFFPDVFYGITVSHQPRLQNATCKDFISSLADSTKNPSPAEIAYLFGYMGHVCTDVFAHHWVGINCGNEGGDFISWTGTPQEIIKPHIGIEMFWDDELRTLPVKKSTDFSINIPYIRETTLTPGSQVFDKYYNDKSNATTTYCLGRILALAKWHEEQEAKTKALKKKIDDKTLPVPCLQCETRRIIRSVIPKDCTHCKATGKITEAFQKACPCRIGTVPVTREVQRTVERTIPGPLGGLVRKFTETTHQIIQETCTQCKGTKLINDTRSITCPECKGKKVNETVTNIPCTNCPFGPVKAICDRYENFHRARKEAAFKTVDSYIEAHRQMARSILEEEDSTMLESFGVFKDNLLKFLEEELSVIDLIAPEVRDIQNEFRDIFSELENAIKNQIPLYDLVQELKKVITSYVEQRIIEEFKNYVLPDSERDRIKKELWSAGSLENFAPMVDSVNLFVLSFDGIKPSLEGVKKAAAILGTADNIDARWQYKSIRPHSDETLWKKCFNQSR